VSYHLEQEGDAASLNDDQEVFDDDVPVKGLSYTKLDESIAPPSLKKGTPEIDDTSPTQTLANAVMVQRREKSSSSCPNTPIEKRRKHTKSLPELNNDEAMTAQKAATPERKSMSPTHSNLTEDMLSVCEGVVQKTREQMAAGLKSAETDAVSSSGSTEEVVPVTPGTVRKVLGQIESRDNLIPRSSSFKLARKKCAVEVESLQRSASVRVKRARPIFPISNLATHSTKIGNSKSAGSEPSSDFHSTFSKIRQIPEDKVKFSIGAQTDSNVQSLSEESDNEELMKIPAFEDSSPSDIDRSAHIQIIEKTNQVADTTGACQTDRTGACQTDSMLKVASKPALNLGCDKQEAGPSSVPVKTLVGAFEDIGSATSLNRPLTIHVDSFSSDPFAQQVISEAEKSPLQRSQSLHIMETNKLGEQLPATHTVGERKTFEVKSYTSSAASSAQKILPPYWKIKRDNANLVHSFSSAAVSSKDGS